MNGDRLDSHFLAGPDDAAGNLAAIGDQDLFELARIESHKKSPQKSTSSTKRMLVLLVPFCDLTFNAEQRLAVLYRLPVLDINLDYFTPGLGLNLVHELHGFNDTDHRLRLDTRADLHERLGGGRRRAIKRADDGRRDDVHVLIVGG